MIDRSVTVVMACFDETRFLWDSVRSVLAQSPAVVRIVIVDDGSTDCSCERVVAELAGGPVTIENIRAPHVSQANALNIGVATVQTPFVAFQDADDLWPQGRLQAQLEAFDADTDAEAVAGAVLNFEADESGRVIRQARFPAARLFASTLFRTASFRRVGDIAADILIHSNVDWWSRAQALGIQVTFVESTVLHRRIHDSNIGVTRRDAARVAMLDQVRRHLRREP